MNMKSLTKTLTDDAVQGGVLYVALKGYGVANHMAGKFLPATISGPIKNVGVALAYSLLADQIAPKKYRSMFGIAAMSEAIAAFVDPFVDPMLVKSDLIGLGSLSTISSYNVGVASGAIVAPAGGALPAAPMAGYASTRGMRGYASARMGGYAMAGATGLPGTSMPGMGGLNMVGLPH